MKRRDEKIPATQPKPILVAELFPPILESLLALLESLTTDEWNAPVVAPGWTVKDVALHLLGGDIGVLSGGRDGLASADIQREEWQDLVVWLNQLNDLWVLATRRMSTRLLCDLLQFTGEQVSHYFALLDPLALNGPVSWAGPDPAPVWLDVAREYTERWHHQQQIRDAVGKPGLTEPRFMAPVLDTFVRALPYTYRSVTAPRGTVVTLSITGAAGNTWYLRSEAGNWELYLNSPVEPAAEVILDQDAAWRLFTKGITPGEALRAATLEGDQILGRRALEMVSVIA
jgi:uncharacterized protein (TIGR03083 family)